MFLTCLVRLHLCTILGCDITAPKDSVFKQKKKKSAIVKPTEQKLQKLLNLEHFPKSLFYKRKRKTFLAVCNVCRSHRIPVVTTFLALVTAQINGTWEAVSRAGVLCPAPPAISSTNCSLSRDLLTTGQSRSTSKLTNFPILRNGLMDHTFCRDLKEKQLSSNNVRVQLCVKTQTLFI